MRWCCDEELKLSDSIFPTYSPNNVSMRKSIEKSILFCLHGKSAVAQNKCGRRDSNPGSPAVLGETTAMYFVKWLPFIYAYINSACDDGFSKTNFSVEI